VTKLDDGVLTERVREHNQGLGTETSIKVQNLYLFDKASLKLNTNM